MAADFLKSLFGLKGQVAVVIGGTGTLGGALAEGIGKAGATVVVAGRGEDRGKACAKRIEETGGEASFATVDVTSRKSIEELLATVLKKHGRVDMLVNSAGANSASTYFDAKDDDWDRVIAANLKSTHLACQIFGQYMAQSGQGGSILNIGSVTADRPLSRVFAYSASKAAVANLTQNVARELAPHGVRVNCLCPGFFPAEQNRAILDQERIGHIMSQTPMARFGEPHELIGTTLLLLSKKAGSYITGAAFYVDGGFTAMRF
jgi:NAD(P)-dependent dehydrogenase (short-subunit alcohol dehydrogenase family)